MNEQQLAWDDLRVVLAIAETGTLSGAARRLGLSHATVFRRLAAMEKKLGVGLFVRARSGYSPTVAGEDLAATAAKVETEVLGAERRLAGCDLKVSGSLRITTTDTLFMGPVAALVTGLAAAYPGIRLEVALSNQLFNLSKRDADVALRPSNSPPETLIGRKVGIIDQAVYARAGADADTIEQAPADSGFLGTKDWVGPDTHLGYRDLEIWMTESGFQGRCICRIDSVLGMLGAIRAGAGIGVLPRYLADREPELVRLTPAIPQLATDLWLLTHPDLRGVARVRAFMDYIVEGLRRPDSGIRPVDIGGSP